MQIIMTDTTFPQEPDNPPTESYPEPRPSSSSSQPRSSTPDPHMEIFMQLHPDDGVHYLGDSNLQNLAEFRIGGREGNILVLKGNEPTCTEVSVLMVLYI